MPSAAGSKNVLNHSFIPNWMERIKMWSSNADALGDIVVVAFGMAIEMGVDLNRVLAEIMRANMSKLDENGRPLINQCSRGDCEQPCMESTHWPKPDDPHGKVLKASGYRGPDIHHVLNTQEPL
jgi:hypothetical protein